MYQHGRVFGLALGLGALLLAGAGCGSDQGPGERDAVGSARVRLVNTQVSAGEITRVTVTAASGASIDLERDASGDGFVGSLILPVGPNSLVGQAFIDDELVAESQATPIVVEEGTVTSVTLRLLDLTGGDDIEYGPLIVSLVHPETAVVGQPALFSVSAVDPDGDEVSIAWSADCADGSFSDPSAAETQWVKGSEGTCNITVVASAGGLSASDSFRIAVFGEGNTGAVDIGGVIVSAPQVFLGLDYGAFCEVFPGAPNGSCAVPIETTQSAYLFAGVGWGNAQPGALEVSDDCGGSFELFFDDPFYVEGVWTPPSITGLCMISARATSPDGVSSELRAAIVVREP